MTTKTKDDDDDDDGIEGQLPLVRIAIGTKNPCKIEAVTRALRKSIETTTGNTSIDLHIEGFSVDSGVRDQPWGDEETVQGARQRALEAYQAYKKAHKIFPHLSFGLEGGLEWTNYHHHLQQQPTRSLVCMAWMAIYGKRRPLLVDALASRASTCWSPDKKPIMSVTKTASFVLPSPMQKLIAKGMELGDADDAISGRTASKHGSGTVGYLTDGMIDRSTYYEQALILALIPWIRPDLYASAQEDDK